MKKNKHNEKQLSLKFEINTSVKKIVSPNTSATVLTFPVRNTESKSFRERVREDLLNNLVIAE